MCVQETGDLFRRDVPAALDEALGENWDRVLMRSHELGQYRSELDLLFKGGYGAMFPREEGRERLHIVVVNA
ncbi:hypothetical protein NPX13_g9320 [Xylaria arbuscula]|uniref:Uncharacterized protein n=1 Tax=Xylaria arbuscula TaxID=114810 RepID=A0A9W8THT8_9PEZI|nr:hypothetical protein NPX13_g9320 [Xylaria arbuscula]